MMQLVGGINIPSLKQIITCNYRKGENHSHCYKKEYAISKECEYFHCVFSETFENPPGWLSGERVGLMTWWLRVRSQVEATFLSGVFSPLTSAEACEKSSRWL